MAAVTLGFYYIMSKMCLVSIIFIEMPLWVLDSDEMNMSSSHISAFEMLKC